VTEETERGLPLRSYFPNTATGWNLSERDYKLEQIIDVFSELYGEYPFEAYGILVIDEFPNANEMQTLPVFNTNAISERVMVHEAAHQWFGNHVTLGDWSEIWLNEGFASYSEFLWREAAYGDESSDLISREGYNYVRTLPPPIPPQPDNLVPVTVYHRGAWTLHALRLKVGDETFFTILRTYFARYGGSHAHTEDFVAIAEELSAQDLQVFFQGWLYDPVPPPVPELE
jgi:aminopeptidase N